jgi:hypothetical protein
MPEGLGQTIKNINQDVSSPKLSEYKASVLPTDGDSVST